MKQTKTEQVFEKSKKFMNGSFRINSPSYPAGYPANTECLWTIIGPEGHFLRINFNDFDFPSNTNCSLTDHMTLLEPNINRTDCKYFLQTFQCYCFRLVFKLELGGLWTIEVAKLKIFYHNQTILSVFCIFIDLGL